MYSYKTSRSSRGGRPAARPRRGRTNKQNIHPSKFVKVAQPMAAREYESANAFSDFAIHPVLKSNIAAKGYLRPSEIQDKAIPAGLSGVDVVGIANTGTGKTAAFAIPILNKLLRDKSAKALIIAPTRELAMQIEEQCRMFAKNSGLRGAVLIGGMPMSRQVAEVRAGAQIIIGTPGRIKDHLQQGTLHLDDFNIAVLDEVDRMLDMGFINDVRHLLASLAETKQLFLFSATMSPEITALIKTFTNDPITINVSVGETSDNVHQNIVPYSDRNERISKLHDVLIDTEVKKALIFGETKHGVERLSNDLIARGFQADALHGGKTQGQRKRALESFRANRVNILVATDVAARGIDVVDITHVINYDVPQTYEDYIHRIGRAGRAGRTGYALTFVELPSAPRY